MNYNEREMKGKPKNRKTLKQIYDEKSKSNNKISQKSFIPVFREPINKKYRAKIIDRVERIKTCSTQSHRL